MPVKLFLSTVRSWATFAIRALRDIRPEIMAIARLSEIMDGGRNTIARRQAWAL